MIGSQLGNYKIVDKLGEGGMGVVYKALDTSLDRVVAIKSLSAELARNHDLELRFRAEAKAQANLNHTNIATLYAFFVQEGTAWMVMEYIEGETFHDIIQRRGPIPAAEAIPLFRQALMGIGYAHRMGIVHRDIKPSNIMVKRDGIVKVMDFGIAKVLGNRGMTRTGTQMGTAYYMSPEQVVNKGVDIRSDVYSLGVTLYEILTANVPFSGDTDFEVMQAHMQTMPPLPTRFYPYIPKGVENAVLHAIAKSPDQRFQTVEEFGLALERPEDYEASTVAAGVAGAALPGGTRLESAATQTMGPTPAGPVAAVPTPATGVMIAPTPRKGPLNRRLMLAGGACAVIVLAALGFILRPKPQPPAPIVSQNQFTSPPVAAQPPGQVEVPVPLLPEESKTPVMTPAAPAPSAGAQPQPNRPAQQQTARAPATPPPGQPKPPQDQSPGARVTSAPPPPPAPAATLCSRVHRAGHDSNRNQNHRPDHRYRQHAQQ